MQVGALLRRWRSDRLSATASAVTVLCSLVMLSSGPIFADAVSLASVRESVLGGSGPDVTIEVILAGEERPGADYDRSVAQAMAAAVAPLPVSTTRHLRASTSFDLSVQADDDLTLVAELIALQEMEAHVTVVDGTWARSDAPLLELMVSQGAADALGLQVDDLLELTPRVGSGPTHDSRIAGIYIIDDVRASFWTGRDRTRAGLGESSLFRTVQVVVPIEAMVDRVPGWSSSWLGIPDFTQIDPADLDVIASRTASLENALYRATLPPDLGRYESWSVDVTTSVPRHLGGSGRALTVARSTVFAVIAGLVLVAGSAVALMAALTFDARQSDAAWWTARGASPRQLLLGVVGESLLVVLPSVAAAPLLASAGLDVGQKALPLGPIELDPRPVTTSYLLVVAAGAVVVALLAWPTWRGHRGRTDRSGRRQLLSGGLQRAGVDVVLLGLAVVAYWQLRTLGDDRAATVRGRFGVDPLVVAAPTLGLVAGTVVALRLVPLLARAAERAISRSRHLVAPLAGWQLTRRPGRYRNSAMFLLIAAAFGVYSLTFSATWEQSQTDQADHQVGSDARVAPNRRTNDSIADPYLTSAFESVEGVERAIPVVIRNAALTGSRPAELIALDAARSISGSPRFDGSARFEEMLALLSAGRPELSRLELPGRPIRLEVDYLVEVLEPEDHPVDQPFRFVMSAMLQDGHGLLHRHELGSFSSAEPSGRVELDLVDEHGWSVSYPLSIVDFELVFSAPVGVDVQTSVELGPVVVEGEDGVSDEVVLTTTSWRSTTQLFSTMSRRPDLVVGSTSDETLLLELNTGPSRIAAPIGFRLRPVGAGTTDGIAAVVTDAWLSRTSTSVGDIVNARLSSADGARVEVLGGVSLVPITDPLAADALLVDLASLQMYEYSSGASISSPDEFWLTLAAGATIDEADLTGEPLRATSALFREERSRVLLNDPPALAAVGGLVLGFVASATIAAVGVVTAAAISARDRHREFALLRSLGMTSGQVKRSLLVEQTVLVVFSVVLGSAVGLALAIIVLPYVSLGRQGTAAVPSVDLVIPWARIAAVQAVVVIGLAIGLVVAMRDAARVDLVAAVREGDAR